MNFLLDTCLLSELALERPNPGVLTWVGSIAEDRQFISVVTVGEIRQGAARLPPSRKRAGIERWLGDALLPRFAGRILSIDLDVALAWGDARGSLLRNGRPAALVDSLIAATALCHDLVLVTRNVADFKPFRIQLLDPWT